MQTSSPRRRVAAMHVPFVRCCRSWTHASQQEPAIQKVVNQIRNTIIMVRTCRRVRNSQNTVVRILNGNTESASINQNNIIHTITNCRSSSTIQPSHFAK
jgi:hypothetical protein